jgi:hypothetical protein
MENEKHRETPLQRISLVSDLLLDELANFFFFRKCDLAFRDKQFVIHSRKCILDKGLVFLRAEQDPDRGIIAVGHFILLEPVDVRIQLAEIFMGETVNLQLDQDVAFQNPVIKDPVNKAMLPSDDDTFLPGFKANEIFLESRAIFYYSKITIISSWDYSAG